MALDGVPWFIGGDAEHGPSVARQLAYLAMNGKEGIVASGDLKVTQLDVPGGGAKIAAGGAAVLSRVSSQEAYTVRNPTADVTAVTFAATGSSAGRSDLVICRVDNPNVDSNAQAPTDTVKGPYVRFAVIAGVPAGTTRLQDIAQYAGVSAITLARVDLPASTGTVTNAMITDLRTLANPRETTTEVWDLGAAVATLSATSGTVFPPFQPSIVVPPWATYARVTATVASVQAGGNSTGALNVQLRDPSNANVLNGNSLSYNADAVVTSTRINLIAGAEGAIPASARGVTVRPTLVARKSDTGQANLKYDTGSQLLYRVTFYERAV
ncbi:hypothetical protein ACWGJ9_07430 [Curtobacterium citreum]